MYTNKVFYFLKESYGGANTFIDLLLKVKSTNIKTFVFCFEKNQTTHKKITYLSDNLSSDYPSLKKLILFIRSLIQSYKIIAEEKPAIIIAGDNYSFIIFNLIKFFIPKTTKLVLRVGNNLNELINSKPFFLYRLFIFLIVRYFVKKTDYIICQSKSGLLDFKKKFNPKKTSKVDFIYNGIDIIKANRLSKEKIGSNGSLFNDKIFKIVAIGRLSKQKDFYTLIKAFDLVHRKNLDSRLFIIGDGNLKPSIKKMKKNLRLNNSVFLLGWQKNVFPYLKRSDLFIHSSNYEGFPFALLEAMSQKLPIISTDTKFGPSEIIDSGKYGILISLGNYKEMANIITKFIYNESLRNKYSGLAYSRVKYFTETKSVSKYKKFLTEAIHNE